MCDKKFEVVISGISGRFPDCESVEELKQKLFSKTNMISVDNRKWIAGNLCVCVCVRAVYVVKNIYICKKSYMFQKLIYCKQMFSERFKLH